MDWIIHGLWWLIATPVIATELAISLPLGIVSGGLSYLASGTPIYEPVVIIHGPRYYSTKLDYPIVGASQIIYIGDEPDPAGSCNLATEVDENTWTFKWRKSHETEGLRGDESRGTVQPAGVVGW